VTFRPSKAALPLHGKQVPVRSPFPDFWLLRHLAVQTAIFGLQLSEMAARGQDTCRLRKNPSPSEKQAVFECRNLSSWHQL